MLEFLQDEERKVEYIELIYDLIFVHTLSRCGSLLNLEEGAPGVAAYMTFLLFSMGSLEIWYLSVLFINRFPQFPRQRNLCIFINMYLLYYLAAGIRDDWRDYYAQIHVACAAILLNLAFQYWFALRKASGHKKYREYMNKEPYLLVTEAAIILLSIPVFRETGLPLSPLFMLVSIGAGVGGQKDKTLHVDFPHLAERVMLYVVFSFGEMIVELSGFFDGGISVEGITHSVLAFAFASGLFLNYGYAYDNIIDRERKSLSDSYYLFLHMFLIISLNYLTQVMEMLRNPAVSQDFKITSLSVWVIVYVLFLSLLERYAKERAGTRYYLRLIQLSAGYVFMLVATHWYPVMNFTMSVGYVYCVHWSVRLFHRRKLAVKEA